MRTIKITLLVVIFLSISLIGELYAQPANRGIIDRTYLEYVDRLPNNLSSEKSLGILISDTRDQSVQMANEAHPIFAKSGIDVVAYYEVDELFSGQILSKPLADEFVKREIRQLIFIIKKGIGYRVVITPFSKDENFVKHGKKAWQIEFGQLSEIMDQIYRMSASLERKNFLISDTPEFGRFSHQVKGRRYEAYKPDLKTEKLAIPLHVPMTLPVDLDGREDIEKTRLVVDSYNSEIALRNEKLRNAFNDYPYPHVFIEESLTEKELRAKGFIYVLHNIHATSNVVRDLLKYEKKQGVTDYIVVRMHEGKGEVVRLKGDLPIYKYYVRSIPADTYYLGAKWDADITDEAALNNHVQLLIAEIR